MSKTKRITRKDQRNGREMSESFRRWHERILPLAKEVKGRWGMAVEVAKQLSDLSGREVPRTQVDQWLNPDVDHMSEPFWGNGEMLCQAIALARLAMDARDAAKERK